MIRWLKRILLWPWGALAFRVFGIKKTRVAKKHYRMTVPVRHHEMVERALVKTRDEAWRRGKRWECQALDDNTLVIEHDGHRLEVRYV